VRRAFVSEFLSFLESVESRLLSWGFYDIGFLPQEIEDLLKAEASEELKTQWQAIEDSGTTLRRLLSDMEQAKLLYRPRENPEVLRTRFAETIRLVARLRQLFKAQDWATGPRLVRDIRLNLKSRRYPERNVPPDAIWNVLGAVASHVALQKAAFNALSMGVAGKSMPYAGFQSRAFARILEFYRKAGGLTGSVISAGTGSGKTKAFYVPALLGIVADLARSQRPFTKVIAIYPRNVLLADQFREAVAETQKLTGLLKSNGLRPITLGAYTGDTPWGPTFTATSHSLKNWEAVKGEGWVVPFIKSPQDGKSDLVWRDADRTARQTALYRRGAPAGEAPVIESGVLQLTRDALWDRPPDILFLSVEMLNREICNPECARTLGIVQGADSPRLLLLDEVHTYEGLAGAQVPWVLRRWFCAAQLSNLHIVGLSATLKDAIHHLAALTGISSAAIEEIKPIHNEQSPNTSEFKIEGTEYNVAVRGNTSAGVPLLATSIQATMLLTRMLTPMSALDSSSTDAIEGAYFYARKLFGFTDNLDTVNRWLSTLSDADNQQRLASLRSARPQPPALPPGAAAWLDGQVWDLAEALQADLGLPLLIDRCSSQDPSVNPRAQAVLATKSLEVGYDDAEVGIVLQHKTPSSQASFIQRKGRAGRRRGTRPMTVAVLSDVGKDRWTFRNSYKLFGDTIDSIRLPVLNPYVLKVQGTQFLIDWVGRSLGQPAPYRYLAPHMGNSSNPRADAKRLIELLLEGGTTAQQFYSDFRQWIQPYLKVVRPGADVERYVAAILWDSPRSLFRHAIPTLLRHLEDVATEADLGAPQKRPLPEYIPGATFSELDSRDVRIEFTHHDKKTEALSSKRFFAEFSPGRVSKRFAIETREDGYWLPVSLRLFSTNDISLTVADICSSSVLVRVLNGISIYEPLGIRLAQRPGHVRDSSQGFWQMQVFAESIGEGVDVPALDQGCWRRAFISKRAHLHRDHDGVALVRYAHAGRYEILGHRDQVWRGKFRLEENASADQTARQAVGYELRCDALMFEISPEHLAAVPALSAELIDRFRVDAFLDELLASPVLQDRANHFAIRSLWESSLAMLTATALAKRCSLEDAQQLLAGKRPEAAERAIKRLVAGAPDDDQSESTLKGRRAQIVDLWRDPHVLAVVQQAEQTLWKPAAQMDLSWLRRRYVHTLAQMIYTATLDVLRDVSETDLSVDVLDQDGRTRIVLAETAGGGLGHIEALLTRFYVDPNAFDTALRAALLECDRESTTATLLEVLSKARDEQAPGILGSAFEHVRQSKTFRDQDDARVELRNALSESNLDNSREAVVAIMASVLRPGSAVSTDRWMSGLNRLWRRKCAVLHVAIPLNVIAYWIAGTSRLQRRLAETLRKMSRQTPIDAQVFQAIESMLLEGCEDSCLECLGTGDPADPGTKPSRTLATDWLGLSRDVDAIEYGEQGWLHKVHDALRAQARVTVRVPTACLAAASGTLHGLLITLIDTDYLLLGASLSHVRRHGSDWLLTWQVRGLRCES
jgi:hypothetical protein